MTKGLHVGNFVAGFYAWSGILAAWAISAVLLNEPILRRQGNEIKLTDIAVTSTSSCSPEKQESAI